MNGPEHYAEAERLAQMYADNSTLADREWATEWGSQTLAAAQVHATLAQAAALSSLVPPDGASGFAAWRDVVKPEPTPPWEQG